MAYITASLTSANPSADLYAAMAPALTTAGFTLVDTVVISTRTHKIWKSAAANNAQGLDWYLDVCYTTTGTGNLWLQPMEMFDPATDLAYRVVLAGGGAANNVEQTYYTRYGASGYSLEHNNWVSNPSTSTPITFTTNTAGFTYRISITGDRVIAQSGVLASNLLYAGMFTPSVAHSTAVGSSLYPLMVAFLTSTGGATNSSGSSANVNVAATRIPKTANLGAGNGWNLGQLFSVGNVGASALPVIPSGALTANAPYQLAPVRLILDFPANNVGVLGMLTDVAVAPTTGVSAGDTVTVSGEPWIFGGTSSGYSNAFRAA